MCFILKPFLYYITNRDRIENYIILESHGEHPHLMPHSKLKPIVKKYIDANNHVVNEEDKEKYIKYICDHLSHDNGN